MSRIDRDLKFKDLIEFLETHLKYAETLKSVMGDKESIVNKPAGKPAGKPGVGTAAAAAFSAGKPGNSAPASWGKSGKPGVAAAAPPPPKKAQKAAQNAQGSGFAAASAQPRNGKPPTGGTQSGGAPMLPVSQSRAPASHPAPPPNKSTWKCKHCNDGSWHLVTGCRVFQDADVPTRHRLMAAGGHCYVCFKRGHKAEDCSDDMASCDICHKRHHTSLHRVKREETTS